MLKKRLNPSKDYVLLVHAGLMLIGGAVLLRVLAPFAEHEDVKEGYADLVYSWSQLFKEVCETLKTW